MAKEKNLSAQLKDIQKTMSDDKYCLSTASDMVRDLNVTLEILIIINNELQETIEELLESKEREAAKIIKLTEQVEALKNEKK